MEKLRAAIAESEAAAAKATAAASPPLTASPAAAARAAAALGAMFRRTDGGEVEIRDVWRENMAAEFAIIRDVVQRYPIVAMDTEFPGVVARPLGEFSRTDFHFQSLRCNIDLLRVIQIGIAFVDKEGNTPEPCACWQFNFEFDIDDDMYAEDSIALLKRAGIDFGMHKQRGISRARFGELIMTSGLVLSPDVSWVVFQGGYDFGYLLKTLSGTVLPEDESKFFELFSVYFPQIFDVKHMMLSVEGGLHGGLQKLADDLGVERVGPMHQAGSDSMLTAAVFLVLRARYFGGDETKGINRIHGFSSGGSKGGGRNLMSFSRKGLSSQGLALRASFGASFGGGTFGTSASKSGGGGGWGG
jgi:CCR4-NOT transcription complex subunit 7/8|tara:strand:- start:71 stop:1144 length:1074 start_codon:yes stop_codon:yes gene_type:complete